MKMYANMCFFNMIISEIIYATLEETLAHNRN